MADVMCATSGTLCAIAADQFSHSGTPYCKFAVMRTFGW